VNAIAEGNISSILFFKSKDLLMISILINLLKIIVFKKTILWLIVRFL
jgi:hypothetical protein